MPKYISVLISLCSTLKCCKQCLRAYSIVFTVGEHRHPDHKHSDVIHVATTSPVCLYSMDTCRQHLSCIDLYDVFPGSAARYQSRQPRLRLAPLGFPLDTNIVIHDEQVGICVACSAVVLLLNTFK